MVVQFSLPPKKKKKMDSVQWHEFLSLDAPHPYGVLPAGNRLLLDNKQKEDGINAPFLRQIRDETWLLILGFCDGLSLGRCVQVCRFFYVAGHQPELWRDLVLRKLQQEPNTKSIIDVVGSSWKDTYVMKHCNLQKLECPSKPIPMANIYSDDLYRLHQTRAFAIPASWLEQEDESTNSQNTPNGFVPRVNSLELTSEQFVNNYETKNQPVLLQGAAKPWKAFRDWQDPAYLRQHTQGRTFRATSGAAPLPANFTLEAFQTYCSHPTALEEAPLYLFDREALQPNSPLHQDYAPDLQRTCPYFDPHRTLLHDDKDTVGHDLFQVLGDGKRPDHTWAILGGSHSGSVFHIDPNATHAWNATICGRKRWIFYPPGITPPGVHPSQDGDEVALPLSIGEWILTFWRDHQERKTTGPLAERPLECTAFPGDVVFVPHGWWHMVINLDHLNIAITHNYVSRSNLGNVLRFLKCKEDQISGCRDRKESIKPEKLHSAMVTALQEQFGQDTEWLVEAQKQAASHWTCKAWKDDDNSKKRTLEEEGTTKDFKKHQSVMVKAKASATAGSTEDSPFSFSFL